MFSNFSDYELSKGSQPWQRATRERDIPPRPWVAHFLVFRVKKLRPKASYLGKNSPFCQEGQEFVYG